MTADLAQSAMMDALTHLFAEDRKGNGILQSSEHAEKLDDSAQLDSAQATALNAIVNAISGQNPSVQPSATDSFQIAESEITPTDVAGRSANGADDSESIEASNSFAVESSQSDCDSTSAENQTAAALPATLIQQENAKPKVSRAELIQIMEGFVELVKNSDDTEFGSNALSFVPPKIEVKDVISVTDRTAEINELRSLLVEAQGTIIRLLTDRVDDRARLATLQNEIRLLPDFKAQSDRALSIASTAEEFKAEFAKVKLEIERMKLAKMRADNEQKPRSWWTKFTDWLKKKDTAGE